MGWLIFLLEGIEAFLLLPLLAVIASDTVSDYGTFIEVELTTGTKWKEFSIPTLAGLRDSALSVDSKRVTCPFLI